MTKLADLDKKVIQDITSEIEAGASNIGQDTYDYASNHFINNKLGVCADCVYLNQVVTEYDKIYARCRELEIPIKGVDPIRECTRYNKRGSLTINEMQDIAYIIEVDKRKIGFE